MKTFQKLSLTLLSVLLSFGAEARESTHTNPNRTPVEKPKPVCNKPVCDKPVCDKPVCHDHYEHDGFNYVLLVDDAPKAPKPAAPPQGPQAVDGTEYDLNGGGINVDGPKTAEKKPAAPAPAPKPEETPANVPTTPEEPAVPKLNDPLPEGLPNIPVGLRSDSKAYVIAYYADIDGCGHGFIKVRAYETPGKWMGFGFYGLRNTRAIFTDTNHMWNRKLCLKIGEDQLKKVFEKIVEWNSKPYNWHNQNCVTFVRDVDKAIGTEVFSFYNQLDLPTLLDSNLKGYDECILNPNGTTSTAEVQETDAQIIKQYYHKSAEELEAEELAAKMKAAAARAQRAKEIMRGGADIAPVTEGSRTTK